MLYNWYKEPAPNEDEYYELCVKYGPRSYVYMVVAHRANTQAWITRLARYDYQTANRWQTEYNTITFLSMQDAKAWCENLIDDLAGSVYPRPSSLASNTNL